LGIGVLLGSGCGQLLQRVNLSVSGPQPASDPDMILDHFGVTLVCRISAFLCSLTSAATGFAGGFAGVLETIPARLVVRPTTDGTPLKPGDRSCACTAPSHGSHYAA